MTFKYVLAAAATAGGLGLMASAPASATAVSSGADLRALVAGGITPVYHRRWHRARGHGWRRGPRFGIYVAPPRRAHRCRYVRYKVWNGYRYVNKTRRAC